VKKKILAMLGSVLVLSVSQLAAAAVPPPPQPAVCPSISAIKPIGVSHTTVQLRTLWFAGRRDNTYDTENEWTFIEGNIPATDAVDAFQKAMVGLKTLFFASGPFYDNQTNRWVCLYATNGGYPAVALNPPLQAFAATDISTYMRN
jgi:hypothetical protein